MPERNEDGRFVRIAYLHLSEGKDEPAVRAILIERGANEEETLAAISTAQRHLGELAAYRNRELLRYLAGGSVLIVIGYRLIPEAATAVGRFRGMAHMIMLLGLATIGFGFGPADCLASPSPGSLRQALHELIGGKLRLAQNPGQRPSLHLFVKRNDAGNAGPPKLDMTSALAGLLESQSFEGADDLSPRKGRKLRHAP